MDNDLEATIVALEGGAANINPDAALQNVEGWRARLDGADFPHAGELRDALTDLASRLARRELQDLGDLLARAGNLVGATVSYAPSEMVGDLALLGDLLHRAGNSVI